ncbi:hypothetical protein [Alterisphingorhabdus coralli]|uniref:Uncharacterized protein n=1 Tax=Alterisphingorhabdus coralli TaxID=3071408 RepID=A0AA97F8X0_9SPHN|nr:hypothetical protein [Parasphingorhabdus sp. SCSIO 66989]WOE76554.1 hypothetical protein RB602_07530 [Parasphingorhabdus sp. SCSIO 66989]
MRSFLTGAATICAIAVLAANGAMAQQQARSDSFQQMRFFDETAIRLALEPQGAEVETRRTESGMPFFFITFNNMKLVAVPQSCNQQRANCVGLVISARYRPPQNVSPQQLRDRVDAFNRSYDYAKAVISSEGVPTVSRYVIADYGTSLGNLRSEFTNTANLAQIFNRQVLGN